MKKLLWALLTLCLLWACAFPCAAENEDAAQHAVDTQDASALTLRYRAKMHNEVRLRKVRDANSRDWLAKAPKEATVDVYEWGEEWCLCGYAGDIGWIETKRMFEYWRVGEDPLPGFVPMAGVAVMTQSAHVDVRTYAGNDLQAGNIICAIDQDGTIPMMRLTTMLPVGSFRFVPFADAQTAQPGEVVYAFTTWYNQKTGAELAKNRRLNIELAVERLTGTVLAPGEKFSFNAICGPYTGPNGYVKAPNISHSGVGVGGGVCQVSTTIFEALEGTPCELTDWQVHQYIGVVYALQNHDSAVGGSKDLKFINRYDFPLEVVVLTQNGALTCLLRRAGGPADVLESLDAMAEEKNPPQEEQPEEQPACPTPCADTPEPSATPAPSAQRVTPPASATPAPEATPSLTAVPPLTISW